MIVAVPVVGLYDSCTWERSMSHLCQEKITAAGWVCPIPWGFLCLFLGRPPSPDLNSLWRLVKEVAYRSRPTWSMLVWAKERRNELTDVVLKPNYEANVSMYSSYKQSKHWAVNQRILLYLTGVLFGLYENLTISAYVSEITHLRGYPYSMYLTFIQLIGRAPFLVTRWSIYFYGNPSDQCRASFNHEELN